VTVDAPEPLERANENESQKTTKKICQAGTTPGRSWQPHKTRDAHGFLTPEPQPETFLLVADRIHL
jgi:hypothetical protein